MYVQNEYGFQFSEMHTIDKQVFFVFISQCQIK